MLVSEKKKINNETQTSSGAIMGMSIEVEAYTDDTATLSELSGDVNSTGENTVTKPSSSRSKGGRPVGSIFKEKEARERKIFFTKNLLLRDS